METILVRTYFNNAVMTQAPRSLLFVSGERPDRFDKALASEADLVCIDLEDAVHPGHKQEARQATMAFLLNQPDNARLALRINSPRNLTGLRDVLALAESGARVHALLCPKAESAQDLAELHAWLPSAFGQLIALIETPAGMEQASAIAGAVHQGAPRLTALMLGGADLSMELGAQFGWDGLWWARARLVNAARSHGLQAWDVPFIDVADAAGLQEETRRVLALGYDCKAAIHPAQLAPLHQAFQPDADELAWARGLLDEVAKAPAAGAFLYQGKLVDQPILQRARRIVRRAA